MTQAYNYAKSHTILKLPASGLVNDIKTLLCYIEMRLNGSISAGDNVRCNHIVFLPYSDDLTEQSRYTFNNLHRAKDLLQLAKFAFSHFVC